jgi:hypothetical protein
MEGHFKNLMLSVIKKIDCEENRKNSLLPNQKKFCPIGPSCLELRQMV